MVDYRRIYIKGGCYFFTVVTHHRKQILLENKNTSILRNAFAYTKQKHPFKINAIAVLPDHLHCIWTLPEKDADFSKRWQIIKKQFSLNTQSEKPIWQPRFWEHAIQDEKDLHNHLDYIHYNPVKHGLVNSPKKWKHSSFEKFVLHGYYENSWGNNEPENIQGMEFE